MAKIFLTTIKKIQQAVVLGNANFVVRPMVALQMRSRAILMAARANPAVMFMVRAAIRSRTNVGIFFVTAPFTTFSRWTPAVQVFSRLVAAANASPALRFSIAAMLRAFTRPAFVVSKLVTGTVRVFVNGAVAATNRTIGALGLAPKVPAYNVLETKVVLTRTMSITTVTQTNVPGLARTDWTNPTNAQGAPNGTLAAINGNGLAVRNGRLVLTYPATTGKTTMTIDKVELWLYYQTIGAIGNIDNLYVRGWYTPPGGTDPGTTLFQSSGAAKNALTTPDVIDISTFIAGSWTNIDNLDLFIDAQIPILSNGITLNVDAMLLKIYATRTEAN